MRRFKQSNKNMKFAKEVLKISKKYGAKEFNTYSGYYIFSFGKHSVIHFLLPNNYKVGIWLDSKDIFAEHLANVDKFKSSRTEFADKFENIEDIKMFIDIISKITNEEMDDELDEIARRKLNLDRVMYHYILNLEDVDSITVKRDDSSLTYNDWYSMDIYVKANSEEETLELADKIEEQITNFYNEISKEYNFFEKDGSIFDIIIDWAYCRNIDWLYKK